MEETTQENRNGLKFAEKQLLRHGWEKGKGLGRSENGISEAIKVQIKCDKGGIGHKEGDQFTFHWWDHAFNKASSSLVVETGQDGVMVSSNNDDLISNKKPRKAQQAKSMLYGSFVKSATLLSGHEEPVKASDSDDSSSSSSSSSSSEDEDTKLDLSSTTKLSDADLLKACGGRTAHKGARHGLTMSAKLARLEQQEQEFMNKYGKKNQPASKVCNNVTSLTHEDNSDATEETKRKQFKRKEPSENNISNGKTRTNVCEDSDVVGKSKKNKESESSAFVNNNTMADAEPKRKKKKNRKDKAQPTESLNGDCSLTVNEAFLKTSEEPHQESDEAASCPPIKENILKKEKKKKRIVGVLEDADVISENSTVNQPQEGSSELQQTSDNVSKKKKKKKSSIDHHETSLSTNVENPITVMMVTEDINSEGQNMKTINRKKKKKE